MRYVLVYPFASQSDNSQTYEGIPREIWQIVRAWPTEKMNEISPGSLEPGFPTFKAVTILSNKCGDARDLIPRWVFFRAGTSTSV